MLSAVGWRLSADCKQRTSRPRVAGVAVWHLKAAIERHYIVSTTPLSRSRSPARQAKRCCILTSVPETRFHCHCRPLHVFALRRPRPVLVLLHRGCCGTTVAFYAGMIGGRDQIHAAHRRTHAELGKSIIGNGKMQPVTGD